MKKITKLVKGQGTFLHGKMQEGLKMVRSSSLSGAMTCSELCMSAKNEERRKIKLRKANTSSQWDDKSSWSNKGHVHTRQFLQSGQERTVLC